MQIVISLPDIYIQRWFDLKDRVGMKSMDEFIVRAIGIGIQTMDAATQIMLNDNDNNVVKFKSDYYWGKEK